MPGNARSLLIDCAELAAILAQPELVVIDCRFDLADGAAGYAAYLEAHIPRAHYAHLDRDLSGPPHTDHGRHPLPSPARMAAVFSALGISAVSYVVAYDDGGGMIAARLWWMLRYLGHTNVALLDGGWQAWLSSGSAIANGNVPPRPGNFIGTPRRDRLVTLDQVATPSRLVDARAPARFRGEIEPLDPHAGHIPGARNHCWQKNLEPNGQFAPPATLAHNLERSLGILPDAATVHYCGSGVSACHNVFAQVLAGLPEPRLYCGSWSEWCSDSRRPRASGEEDPQ